MQNTNYLLKGFSLSILFMLLIACSGITVSTDWDPSVDFSAFKAFTVLENTDNSINRLTNQRILNALVADLSAKGLKKVDSQDKADIAIGYTVTTEQRNNYQTVHTSIGASHGFQSSNVRFRGTGSTSRTTQHVFTVGTLIIAAYQTSKKELVWEGSASGTISTTSSNPQDNQERINEAVQKILADFPPEMKE